MAFKLFDGGVLGSIFKKKAEGGYEEQLREVRLTGEPGKDPRWDQGNRPKGYILGVTPGFASFESGQARLWYMGLARKITKAARLGFEFAEIDYEALSEMYEANLEEQIRRIREMEKIEFGIHMPVAARWGEVDLCLSEAFWWKFMHEAVRKSAWSAATFGAKFILFHTSSRMRPNVTFKVGHREAPGPQVSHDGINLATFIEKVEKGEYVDAKRGPIAATPLKDWFLAKFLRVLYHAMGVAANLELITFFDEHAREKKGFKEAKKIAAKKYDDVRADAWTKIKAKQIAEFQHKVDDWRRQVAELQASRDPRARDAIDELQRRISVLQDKIGALEAAPRIEDIATKEIFARDVGELEVAMTYDINEGKNPHMEVTPSWLNYARLSRIKSDAEHLDFEGRVYEYWKERMGSEAEESVTYHIIGKYMYLTKDPLWLDIVGDYDPDDIKYDADKDEIFFSKDKSKRVMDLVEKWIAAVAGKFIQGHFWAKGIHGMQEFSELKEKLKGKEVSIYEFCKVNRIQVFIETVQPSEEVAGNVRIISAADHIRIIKQLDPEWFSYNIDFEHLTVNYVRMEDHITELEKMGESMGKFIRMAHVNAPRPIGGTHGPVYVMSHDMYIIYRWLWRLRKIGLKNAYFIWEMGSFPIDQSAIAFKNLVEELKKETHPNSLPDKFYGLGADFEAQQIVAIREHARAPLEGLITVPEEEWTLLGRAAVEKGKGEVWRAGRFK